MKGGGTLWRASIVPPPEAMTSSAPPPGIAAERWSRLKRYVGLSFGLFICAIAACVLIAPEGARDNNGISYYDHVGLALVPYVIGVLSIAAIAVLAARDLPTGAGPWGTLRLALDGIAALLAFIILTPDYVNRWFNVAHIVVSVVLFGGQFALIAWLTFATFRDRTNVRLFVLLSAVGLLAGASEIGWTSYLFLSQVAFQLVFLIFLVRMVIRLDPGGTLSEAASRDAPASATDQVFS